jgi:hypothetical protein
MTPDLGSALVNARIATGLDPIEAYQRTDEILLGIHKAEMKRIDDRYDRILAINAGKNDDAWVFARIVIGCIVIMSVLIVVDTVARQFWGF